MDDVCTVVFQLWLNGYTIVQTVFKLGSNRTAFPSTDFALVSYMGFSKAACPLLFSCTEHPVYCVFGAVLDRREKKNRGKKRILFLGFQRMFKKSVLFKVRYSQQEIVKIQNNINSVRSLNVRGNLKDGMKVGTDG